jgi:hypothetical protein
MLSLHDNNVYGYEVDCEHRRIVLHTEYEHVDPIEFIDVVFIDVLAHSFEAVLEGNILFDIEQVDQAAIVNTHAEVFRESWRVHGWPSLEYRGDLNLLVNLLREQSFLAYEIQSSYGMTGWVFAKDCRRSSRAERFVNA